MAQGNAVKVLEKPEASALGEMVNAELSNQIATAKKYPRDEVAALTLLERLATKSDAVAESCMYTLKRKDKDGTINFITGPSVRFAELLVYAWGNMRAGARITEEGEKAVVAQGVAYDLQRNNGLMLEVRRGITTSTGYRFGSDMINVTSNAACSIALRNAVFDCIPQVLWWDVYEAIKVKAVGAAQIPERIQKAVKFFVSKGAKQEDVITAMGVKAIDEMGRAHLEIFLGLQTALKEGSIDAAKIFTADGAEQRARLSLTDDDGSGDDGSGDQFNTIDKQVAGRAAPGKEKGGARKDAAPKAREDGPEPSGNAAGAKKAKAEKGEAGSAAASEPKQEGGGEPPENVAPAASAAEPAEAGDKTKDASPAKPVNYAAAESAITDIESHLSDGKQLSARKAVNAHRENLEAAAACDQPNLAARAKAIIEKFPRS